jgi:hypothetical protein
MGFKSFMGSVSPLYGAVTGEGTMGKLLNPAEAAKIAQEEQMRNEAAAEQANMDRQAQIASQYSGGMKKGGKVRTASQRADGIAIRGKTRA